MATSRSARRSLIVLVVGLGLCSVLGWRVVKSRPEPKPTPAPSAAKVEAPAPVAEVHTSHLRGSVRTPAHSAVARATVSLYAIESPHPSLCGGSATVELFDEDCPAMRAELQRLLAHDELRAVPLASAQTDEDGLFDFPVPPGKYDLVADAGRRGLAIARDATPEKGGVMLTVAPAYVDGQVLGGSEDQPVRNAAVSVIVARPRLVWSTHIAEDGTYRVGPLPTAEERLVWVTAPGFGAHLEHPAKQEHQSPITLARLHRVVGLVTNEDLPVPGAEVRLDGERTTRTDASGHYVFAESDCLFCSVEARRGPLAGAGELPDSQDGQDAIVNVAMSPWKNVRVRVTDQQTGLPVAAEVAFNRTIETDDEAPSDVVPKVQVSLDRSGVFIASPMLRGSYDATVSSNGYVDANVPVEVTGEEGQTVTIPLQRAPVLRGVVVSSTGAPVAGAIVASDDLKTTSGPNGTFSLEGIEPGDVELDVRHPAFQTIKTTLTVPSTAPIRLILTASTHVDVKVVDPRGYPVAAELHADDGTSEPTDENGHATLHFGTEEASVSNLVATARGFAPSRPVDLNVPAGGSATVELKLQPGLTLDGIVTDERGKAIPGVALLLVPPRDIDSDQRSIRQAPEVPLATSDLAGKFHITGLVDADYQLQVMGQASSNAERVHAGDKDVRVTIPRAATVRGRVTSEGEPVTEFDLNGERLRSTDGAFTYELASDVTSLVFRGRFVTTSIPVDLSPGKEQDLRDIEVPGFGRVEGRVRQNGQPVLGVKITVELPEDHRDQGDIYAVSNTQGGFALSEAPGPIHLNLATRAGTLTQDCVVASGRTTGVDIEIPGSWTVAQDAPRPSVPHAEK